MMFCVGPQECCIVCFHCTTLLLLSDQVNVLPGLSLLNFYCALKTGNHFKKHNLNFTSFSFYSFHNLIKETRTCDHFVML